MSYLAPWKNILTSSTQRLVRLLLFSACFHSSIQAAEAERDFPCLSGSIGKQLLWNASWQSDRADDNIAYTIKNLLHVESNTSYGVVVELESTAVQSTRQTRHLNVANLVEAKAVCERLDQNSTAGLPPIAASTSQSSSSALPQFIRYDKEGWVRGDLPVGPKILTTCPVLGRNFLCLEEDRARHGKELENLANQLRNAPTGLR